jgi:hypothetical protein
MFSEDGDSGDKTETVVIKAIEKFSADDVLRIDR